MSADAAQLLAWSDEIMLRNFETLARLPPAGRDPVPPRRFGSVVAFATGRRLGYFNALLALEPAKRDDIAAAAAWLRADGGQFSARLREDVEDQAVRTTLSALGLVREAAAEPGMVLHPLGPPPAPPDGLTIEVFAPASMPRWYEAATMAWSLDGAAAARLLDTIPAYIAGDPSIRIFAGFVDGAPVATSLAVIAEDVVGVYAVATLDSARGRGYGTAMTWAAVEAGRASGCRAAALQASPMGERVYRRMGFEIATRYVTWESRGAPDEQRGW